MHLHSIILTEENWQNKPNHEDQNILEDTENKGCYSIAPKDKCPILIHDSDPSFSSTVRMVAATSCFFAAPLINRK